MANFAQKIAKRTFWSAEFIWAQDGYDALSSRLSLPHRPPPHLKKNSFFLFSLSRRGFFAADLVTVADGFWLGGTDELNA